MSQLLLPSAQVPAWAWRQLLLSGRVHHFEAGQSIYEEDSPARALWLIRSGTAELYKSFFGEHHRLTYVSRGAALGEANLFEHVPRSHSARAVTRVRAYELAPGPALEFLKTYPQLALGLMRIFAARSGQVEQSLVEQLSQRNLELQMQNTRLEHRVRRRVKDLEQTNQSLSQLAWTDSLTGAHNRRSMEKVLEAACDGSEGFAVAMFDVDHFKHYNDTHGHPEGDRALQTLVRLLARRLRSNDVLARYGGEEFLLVLRDIDGPTSLNVCERLRQAITDYAFPYEEQQPLGDFTVSMGLAVFPLEGQSPEQLLKLADDRLYEAKHRGRNQLVGGDYASL